MTHLPRIIPLNTFPGFLGRWNRWTNIYSCPMGYQQQADQRRILPKSSSWNSEFNWANLGVTIPTKKRTFSAVCERPVKVITACLTSQQQAGRASRTVFLSARVSSVAPGAERLPCFLPSPSVVAWVLHSTLSYHDQLKLKVATPLC